MLIGYRKFKVLSPDFPRRYLKVRNLVVQANPGERYAMLPRALEIII